MGLIRRVGPQGSVPAAMSSEESMLSRIGGGTGGWSRSEYPELDGGIAFLRSPGPESSNGSCFSTAALRPPRACGFDLPT